MRKRILIISCTALLLIVIFVCAVLLYTEVTSIGADTDFNVESLRWTIISAMGGWVGSIFGAVALIVSLFALWLPQKVKIGVSVSCGMLLSQAPGIDKIDAYVITVKNLGMKPVTINNIYLNFGGKRMGDIFVGMLNQESPLQLFTPSFPKRLEEGESFDYYLLRDKLNEGLAHNEDKTSPDTPLFIRVDEVTKGNIYCKTKWTLKSFIDK